MSRTLDAALATEVQAQHIHKVLMARLDFSTPVFVHSGYGVITFESNDYLGIGTLGSVSGIEESEDLTPTPVRLTLSGIESSLLAYALDATEYGSEVTIYEAARNDDGTLIGSPQIIYRGTVENTEAVRGTDNSVVVVVQHVLQALNEKSGKRYSDAYQQSQYSGDVAFEFIALMADIKLRWGAPRTSTSGGGNQGGGPGPRPSFPDDLFTGA